MITINRDEKLIYTDDVPLKLTKSEYKILEFLLENKNKIFSREELMQEIWKKTVELKTVNVAISRLRTKLGDYSRCIVSRNGFGYGYIDH